MDAKRSSCCSADVGAHILARPTQSTTVTVARAQLQQFPRDRPLVALAVSILTVQLVGAAGSLFTAAGLDVWYETLEQPALAPPNWVFAPVWTTLFALTGAAAWLVWRQALTAPRAVARAGVVFAVHFVFNVAWSGVFFGLQAIGWALAVIGVLWVLIAATMVAFRTVDRRAGLLLLPYLLWVSFAAYLNYQFWVLN